MVIECDFLSIKEFAGKVGIHPNTVRRAIKSGKISAVKLGTRYRASYRIAKTELDRISLLDMEDMIEKMIEKRMQSKI